MMHSLAAVLSVGLLGVLAFASPAPLRQPTVGSGVLGDGWLDIATPRRLSSTGAGGRRMAFTAPATIFKVEDCNTIGGLSVAKRTALVKASITKCINVFGVLIAGHSGLSSCNGDANMIFLANYVAELLDTNKDGKVSDPKVVAYIDSFSSSGAKSILLAGCNENQEVTPEAEGFTNLKSGVSASTYSSQGWKPMNDGMEPQAALSEEAFHMVHMSAWAKAYPVFAASWTSSLGLCVKQAQCLWYLHPENPGCSSAAGVACKNMQDGVAVACTGACASFSTPGQCYATEHNCADVACDLPEFFNQVFNIYFESKWFYPVPGGEEGGFYPLITSSGANSQKGLKAKMELTSACTTLLNDMKNTKYALPRAANQLMGVYTVKNATSANPWAGNQSAPAVDGSFRMASSRFLLVLATARLVML